MIVFQAYIELEGHGVLKNSKRMARGGWVYTEPKTAALRKQLTLLLKQEKILQKLNAPIGDYMNAKMLFYFPPERFYTKEGRRNRKVQDLSNLYQMVEDVMQEVGIIVDDHFIDSHNGSDRLPSLMVGMRPDKFYLKIELTVET